MNPIGRDLALTLAAHIKALVWVSRPHLALHDIQVSCAEKATSLAGRRGTYYQLFISCPLKSWQLQVSSTHWAAIIDGFVVSNMEEVTVYVLETLL